MSGNQPWFRFFPSDWLARTRGLSPAETGILITLVSLMYERGGPVPRDDGRIARMCGLPLAGFRSILTKLIDQDQVIDGPDGLWNEWVSVEHVRAIEKTEAARKSAKVRWPEKSNKNNSNGDAIALRTQSDRNANQNQNLTPIGPKGRNASIDLSGASREIGTYTAMGINREAALSAPCRRCAAGPNLPCRGTDGVERARPHIERYQIVAHERNASKAVKAGELPVIHEGDR